MLTTSFKNHVAIVTGAGQGIGFGIAKALAVRDAFVILNDMDEALAEDAANKINDAGGICIPMAGDASDYSFIQDLVNKTVKQYGKLTIAIANAGITIFGDFFSYKEDKLNKVLDLNIKGTFFLAQAAANQMIKQKSGGSILFTSSVTGHQAAKDLEAYGMTKAAIEMLAKSLVVSLSQHKISVNAIAPGATLTERTTKDQDYETIWSKLTPMGRAASVDDIVNAALFFVSPSSKHITGQSLIIDGGWTCVSPS